MSTHFINRWPWKTQERLTIALLPVLGAIPAVIALTAHTAMTTTVVTLPAVTVLLSALLWWTGHSRKAQSEIRANLDGDTLSVSSRRHGETSGLLNFAAEVRPYRHTVTGENMLSVRTVTGELRLPVRLLTGNPDLAAIVAERTGCATTVASAVAVGAL